MLYIFFLLVTLFQLVGARPGSMHHVHFSNKEAVNYANSSLGERSFVSLVELYVSKLPSKAKEKDRFYCRPISSFVNDQPWYCDVPV